MQIPRRAMWKHVTSRSRIFRPLTAMRIPRRAMWKHIRYRSGIFTPVESYANTTQSHVKTYEISLRHLQTCWKTCKYYAEPYENTWNIDQEPSDLLRAMQISGKPGENTWNIPQESPDLLKAMQVPRRASWKHMKCCSKIFKPVDSHANTMQSHVKTCETSLRNLQPCWKPCKYHAQPCETTWNIAQESSDLLKAVQIPRRAARVNNHKRVPNATIACIYPRSKCRILHS